MRTHLPIFIDYKQYLRGESSADAVPDKGFSPSSYGLNLTKTRGLMYFAESSTDRGGATLLDNPIASTYDKNSLGQDAYVLDASGNFYTLNAGVFTKRQAVAADSFILGTSELLQFQGNTYATTATRIVQLTSTDLTGAMDSAWWTGLTTAVRHPLERVEDTLYIGDKNLIHAWNGATSTSAYVTLPTDVQITSLRKHPDGKTLLAFCGLTADFSHTRAAPGRIYFIDVNIKAWTREIEIDFQVEGTRNVGGIIYCTYGNKVGYFDGNGIKFLKKLTTSATTYSHNLGDWEGTLLIRDGKTVLAYGDLGAGRVWWRPYSNDVNTQQINNIFYKGSDALLIGFSDGAGAGKLVELNMANSGLSGKFYANKTDFPLQAHLRQLDVLHTQSSGTTIQFTVYNKDETDTENTIYVANQASVVGTWMKHVLGLDIQSDITQLVVAPSAGDLGYKFIRVFYDYIEPI